MRYTTSMSTVGQIFLKTADRALRRGLPHNAEGLESIVGHISHPIWYTHACTLLKFTCSAEQESLSSPIDRRSDYYRQRARQQQQQPQSQAASSGPQPLLTAPNVLTFARLLMVPVLVVLWFLPHRLAPLASALTFIFAAITDWADGYLARRVSSCSGSSAVWQHCRHGLTRLSIIISRRRLLGLSCPASKGQGDVFPPSHRSACHPHKSGAIL